MDLYLKRIVKESICLMLVVIFVADKKK